MKKNKKSPQAANAGSEGRKNHIKCNYCQKQIHINDNYCGKCGRVNPKEIS